MKQFKMIIITVWWISVKKRTTLSICQKGDILACFSLKMTFCIRD